MKPAEIAALMAEVLQVNEFTEHDNFFELGGSSLLAVALVSKINEKSSAEVSLIDLIYAPTAAGITERLARGGAR
ncbi:phosphopantetheine-binding protein [Streptomyces goshikiensis]|uniref:phosphopantetheine-binding protein n=1 Tax=Streptomyces goshikiensis TaxID=1942 RepID=UPI00331C282C